MNHTNELISVNNLMESTDVRLAIHYFETSRDFTSLSWVRFRRRLPTERLFEFFLWELSRSESPGCWSTDAANGESILLGSTGSDFDSFRSEKDWSSCRISTKRRRWWRTSFASDLRRRSIWRLLVGGWRPAFGRLPILQLLHEAAVVAAVVCLKEVLAAEWAKKKTKFE